MSTIHYKIQFFSFWHCGSGLAAGPDVDALVIKDAQGLPFVPGKTIKGLVKEAAETIIALQGKPSLPAYLFGTEVSDKSRLFFSDATLPDHDYIYDEGLSRYIYRKISSTRIVEDGIVKPGSLRKVEVVIPCALEGKILGLQAEDEDILGKALRYIKAIGLNRKRGLGRCTIRFDIEQV